MKDPTNRDRAEWAATTLDTFQIVTGVDAEDAVSDLLSDLMHYCNHGNGGETFETALARGRMHYEAEIEEEKAMCFPAKVTT